METSQKLVHDRNSVIADIHEKQAENRWETYLDAAHTANAQALDRITALLRSGQAGSDINKALDLVVRINDNLAQLATVMHRIEQGHA